MQTRETVELTTSGYPPKPWRRRANVTVFSFALALLLPACGAGQRPADVGPRGTLRFEVEPGEAVVEVDEQRLGPASMFETKGLLLKPGQHRVVLRAEGFFTEYQLVEITENQVTVLELELRPVPE